MEYSDKEIWARQADDRSSLDDTRNAMKPALQTTFLLLFLAICVQAPAAAKDRLRLGLVAYSGEAINLHALARGYFEDEELDVEVVINHAGYVGFQQVLRGELDIATVAPTPIVYRAMRQPDPEGSVSFLIIASILESTQLNNLVVIDQRNTPMVADLVGKRVAMTRGTASEYFWFLVAKNEGIDPDSVDRVDMRVTDMAAAAARGEIDAAVTWTPFDEAIIEHSGGVGKRLPVGRIYTTNWLVVVSPRYLEDNFDAVTRYLRALARAESDFKRAPREVAGSHARWVDTSEEALLEHYQLLEFDLSLTEALIVGLHQQAEWARQAGYASGPVPDFRAYLAPEALTRVRPLGVRLLQ